jgi:hypothetical protein
MSRPSTPTLAASAVAVALGAALVTSSLTGDEPAQAAPKHLVVPVAATICAPARPSVITVRVVQSTPRVARPAPRARTRTVIITRPVVVQRVTVVNRVSTSTSVGMTSQLAPVTPTPIIKDDDEREHGKHGKKHEHKREHGKKHCKKHRH